MTKVLQVAAEISASGAGFAITVYAVHAINKDREEKVKQILRRDSMFTPKARCGQVGNEDINESLGEEPRHCPK
jgi:hypothetical protein